MKLFLQLLGTLKYLHDLIHRESFSCALKRIFEIVVEIAVSKLWVMLRNLFEWGVYAVLNLLECSELDENLSFGKFVNLLCGNRILHNFSKLNINWGIKKKYSHFDNAILLLSCDAIAAKTLLNKRIYNFDIM